MRPSRRAIRPSAQAVAHAAVLRELAPWAVIPILLGWAFLGFLAS
jgi:hypothetical protein